uniref:Protein kinase domain-containing protein n=1 Tax=Ditylenchus dipsaci TaxID=166011 RepID=A0A915DLF5_9BILA
MVMIVEYLQARNLVHRDLKPENFLFCTDGYLKLADFGHLKMTQTTYLFLLAIFVPLCISWSPSEHFKNLKKISLVKREIEPAIYYSEAEKADTSIDGSDDTHSISARVRRQSPAANRARAIAAAERAKAEAAAAAARAKALAASNAAKSRAAANEARAKAKAAAAAAAARAIANAAEAKAKAAANVAEARAKSAAAIAEAEAAAARARAG